LGSIGAQQGDAIAGADAVLAQRADALVATCVELSVTPIPALRDDRGSLRQTLGPVRDVHPLFHRGGEGRLRDGRTGQLGVSTHERRLSMECGGGSNRMRACHCAKICPCPLSAALPHAPSGPSAWPPPSRWGRSLRSRSCYRSMRGWRCCARMSARSGGSRPGASAAVALPSVPLL